MIQIKTISLSQGNPENNDQILTFYVVLHYITLHYSFFDPVTLSSRDRRQRKQIITKETDAIAIMLYSIKKEAGHETPKDKSTNKKN